MTTSRLVILLAIVLAGFGSVFVLPRQLGYQPVGMKVELPENMSEWWGRDLEVSEKERTVLGEDTTIARKNYENGRGDHAVVSLILSGQDMMRNIHRPERCLEAQGWFVKGAQSQTVQVEGFGPITVTRLSNSKTIRVKDKTFNVDGICYYFFIGATRETGSHLNRVIMDSWDRLAKGYDQRWGMVLINSEITKPFTRFGRDEKETEEMLRSIIAQVAPKIMLDSVRPG